MTQIEKYFKINAFREEFPFLNQIANLTRISIPCPKERFWDFCTDIKVRRITKEILLSNTFIEKVFTDEAYGVHYFIKNFFFFFDKHNKFITSVKSVAISSNCSSSDEYQERTSTPMEELAKQYLENKFLSQFHYLLKYESGFVTPNVDDCDCYFKLTIFKPAKNESLADMVEEEINKAKIKVKAESNF